MKCNLHASAWLALLLAAALLFTACAEKGPADPVGSGESDSEITDVGQTADPAQGSSDEPGTTADPQPGGDVDPQPGVVTDPQPGGQTEITEPDPGPGTEPVTDPPTEPADEPAEEPVTEPVDFGDGTRVVQVTLDKYTVTVAVGESDMPWVTMLPTTAPEKGEIWTSDNTEIATVNSWGKITGVAEGKCKVTVRSKDNPDAKAVVDVEVVPKELIHVTGLTLDKYEVTVQVGLSDMPWVTMTPANADDKSEIWESSNPSIASVDKYGRIKGLNVGVCTVTVQSHDNPLLTATVNVKVVEKPRVMEPTYIEGILVVNKTYALPSTYNPGVDPTAQAALDAMTAAAAEDGIELIVKSGFRSYDLQTTLYNNYVGRDGQTEADRYSARPGHSEHQAGLAFDLNSFEQTFGSTPEGKWIAEHCWEFGFIRRYPADKEEITGFMYEPWHVRFIGKTISQKMKESGQCLEEYLGITSAYAQ